MVNLYFRTTTTVRRTETKSATLTVSRLREILGVPKEARIEVNGEHYTMLNDGDEILVEWSITEEYKE